MPVDTLTAMPSTVLPVPYSDGAEVGFTALQQDEVAITYLRGSQQYPTVDWVTFTVGGQERSETQIATSGQYQTTPVISLASAGGYGLLGVVEQTPNGERILFNEQSASYTNNPKYGGIEGPQAGTDYLQVGVYPSATGFHLEWIASGPDGVTLNQENVDANGVVAGSLTQTAGSSLVPYAGTMVGGVAFTVEDNQAQLAGGAAVNLPGEASGAVSQVVAQGLATNTGAAVAWVDSGVAYEALFDAASNSFGPVMTLASGNVSDLHMVALPDGSYVVSWAQGPQHEGEVFNARGEGGGAMSLGGDVAGVTSQGNLYTVGTFTSGANAGKPYVTQFTVGDQGAALVHTSDANYMANDATMVIYLTGSNQTATANASGDIIWSNDTGNTLIGGTGADTFHLGRGGDQATGGGGADTFALAQVPWSGGRITDFQAGDVLDLTGLMSTTADTGSDGFADGYLKITDSGQGAQVWAQYATSGSNSGWWLVETLDGVSASNLATQGDKVTVSAGASGGGGGGPGQTYTSDNNGDTWVGTGGDDTFHLGRGGDHVTGNGGNDTYAFAEIPWGGGHITDFNAGDELNLTGLMSTTADTGADGFADGYLKITDSSQGAQVWAQYATSGSNSGWWLVETLDGVSASSLTTHRDVVTVGGSSPPPQTSVTTSDSNYVAPSYVTSITLTGSQQHIDASATNGVTINSNNTGNNLIGGSGADTFHLGRGGDVVTGGAGADTFAYAETPWAAGVITDFNGGEGDAVDVSGLLAKSGYTGSDPFADGYLQLTSDAHDNAQLWSDVHQAGNDGWWLVATLDGVSTSSLHYSGGLIT